MRNILAFKVSDTAREEAIASVHSGIDETIQDAYTWRILDLLQLQEKDKTIFHFGTTNIPVGTDQEIRYTGVEVEASGSTAFGHGPEVAMTIDEINAITRQHGYEAFVYQSPY